MEAEKKRIEAAKMRVFRGRVGGDLAVARALGDYKFKYNTDIPAKAQAVTAYPEVKRFDRSEDDLFIVNACDGIWDCLSNEECAAKFDT